MVNNLTVCINTSESLLIIVILIEGCTPYRRRWLSVLDCKPSNCLGKRSYFSFCVFVFQKFKFKVLAFLSQLHTCSFSLAPLLSHGDQTSIQLTNRFICRFSHDGFSHSGLCYDGLQWLNLWGSYKLNCLTKHKFPWCQKWVFCVFFLYTLNKIHLVLFLQLTKIITFPY